MKESYAVVRTWDNLIEPVLMTYQGEQKAYTMSPIYRYMDNAIIAKALIDPALSNCRITNVDYDKNSIAYDHYENTLTFVDTPMCGTVKIEINGDWIMSVTEHQVLLSQIVNGVYISRYSNTYDSLQQHPLIWYMLDFIAKQGVKS